jgi:hypothetical protein
LAKPSLFPHKCKQTPEASIAVFLDYWTENICHWNAFISSMIRYFSFSKIIIGGRACGHLKKYLCQQLSLISLGQY